MAAMFGMSLSPVTRKETAMETEFDRVLKIARDTIRQSEKTSAMQELCDLLQAHAAYECSECSPNARIRN